MLQKPGNKLGVTGHAASHCLPAAVLPSSPLWPTPTSPKCLSLAKLITTKIHVKRMTRQLKGNIKTYAGKGSISAHRRCGCDRSMERISIAEYNFYEIIFFIGSPEQTYMKHV